MTSSSYRDHKQNHNQSNNPPFQPLQPKKKMAKIEGGSPGREFKQTSNRTNQQRYDLWIQKREEEIGGRSSYQKSESSEGGRNPNCGNGELGKRSNTFVYFSLLVTARTRPARRGSGAGPARAPFNRLSRFCLLCSKNL